MEQGPALWRAGLDIVEFDEGLQSKPLRSTAGAPGVHAVAHGEGCGEEGFEGRGGLHCVQALAYLLNPGRRVPRRLAQPRQEPPSPEPGFKVWHRRNLPQVLLRPIPRHTPSLPLRLPHALDHIRGRHLGHKHLHLLRPEGDLGRVTGEGVEEPLKLLGLGEGPEGDGDALGPGGVEDLLEPGLGVRGGGAGTGLAGDRYWLHGLEALLQLGQLGDSPGVNLIPHCLLLREPRPKGNDTPKEWPQLRADQRTGLGLAARGGRRSALPWWRAFPRGGTLAGWGPFARWRRRSTLARRGRGPAFPRGRRRSALPRWRWGKALPRRGRRGALAKQTWEQRAPRRLRRCARMLCCRGPRSSSTRLTDHRPGQ
mmetsp:Transcript_69967/g.186444  ORF Transcript_69967/g.186444 Transcript_69967/m.186444 type:complete len:368 (+) Transcript_69967:765-1868(+)